VSHVPAAQEAHGPERELVLAAVVAWAPPLVLVPFLAFVIVVFIVTLMLVSLLVLPVSLALLLAMTLLLLLLLFVMFGGVARNSRGYSSA
jgi:hypothetical protein